MVSDHLPAHTPKVYTVKAFGLGAILPSGGPHSRFVS